MRPSHKHVIHNTIHITTLPSHAKHLDCDKMKYFDENGFTSSEKYSSFMTATKWRGIMCRALLFAPLKNSITLNSIDQKHLSRDEW